ncbi:hypothetical protein UY536_03690 [Paenibacillus polymyxa]|nr:hypothetical protein [Paenibacillus polymyxa]MDY7989877.1 hypothetical protein [Paenibacillus polymyxa]
MNEFRNNENPDEDFYMYRTYQFMKIALDYINDTDVNPSSIKEVQELSAVVNETGSILGAQIRGHLRRNLSGILLNRPENEQIFELKYTITSEKNQKN